MQNIGFIFSSTKTHDLHYYIIYLITVERKTWILNEKRNYRLIITHNLLIFKLHVYKSLEKNTYFRTENVRNLKKIILIMTKVHYFIVTNSAERTNSFFPLFSFMFWFLFCLSFSLKLLCFIFAMRTFPVSHKV